MIIVMFTLVGDLNPYRYSGMIHNDALDNVLSDWNAGWSNSLPYDFDFALNTSEYISGTYGSILTDNEQMLDPIAVKGYNIGLSFNVDDPTDLSDIGASGIILPLVETVYGSLESAFAYQYSSGSGSLGSIDDSSYQLLTATPQVSATENMFPQQLYAILSSGLSTKDMVLPLIAQAILRGSYEYWSAVYNLTQLMTTPSSTAPGYNGWLCLQNLITYWNSTFGTSYDIGTFAQGKIDWRELIQIDVKGGLLGAMVAKIKHPDHSDQAFIVGAGTAATAASLRNYYCQVIVGLSSDDDDMEPHDMRRRAKTGAVKLTSDMFKYNIHTYNTKATQKLFKSKKVKPANSLIKGSNGLKREKALK